MTAAELLAAGALLTAGSTIVEKISKDSAPQITVSEITWNQDQGTALIKFETVQGDSRMSNWEICGWTVSALGIVILAIPTIRAINRVIKACGDHTKKYSLDKKHSKDQKDRETEGKYKAVSYTPQSLAEHKDTNFYPKPTNSMARFQEKLDNEINFLDKDRESKNED